MHAPRAIRALLSRVRLAARKRRAAYAAELAAGSLIDRAIEAFEMDAAAADYGRSDLGGG